MAFAARGFDQHGSIYPVREAHWSATGGSIDEIGRFTAEDPSFYSVTVTGDDRSASAHVQVSSGAKPAHVSGGLTWSGAIPPQKWTQFYMRILTKLVAKPGLELRVDLRLPASAEVSDATKTEVELALRELGLDDEVGRGS